MVASSLSPVGLTRLELIMRLPLIVAALLALPAAHAAEPEFTRICMNGETAGKGSCPSLPAKGSAASQWACSQDMKTGLTWSINSLSGTWSEATSVLPAKANANKQCGLSQGWRAPTRQELLSLHRKYRENDRSAGAFAIIAKGRHPKPAINLDYFPDTRSDWYWSSDTLDQDTSFAWYVYFAAGHHNQSNAYSGFKTSPHYVRLVNSGS